MRQPIQLVVQVTDNAVRSAYTCARATIALPYLVIAAGNTQDEGLYNKREDKGGFTTCVSIGSAGLCSAARSHFFQSA